MRKIIFLFAVTGFFFISCNNSGNSDENKKDSSMSSSNSSSGNDKEAKDEKNKQTALALLHAVISHDVDAIFKDCAPDFVEYGDGSSPPIKNLDTAKTFVRQYFNAFPDFKGEDLNAVADGDWVMVSGNWSGTFKNDMMGMKPTNKAFHFPDVDILKFNDAGKVTEHHSVQSNITMMTQLGVKMEK